MVVLVIHWSHLSTAGHIGHVWMVLVIIGHISLLLVILVNGRVLVVLVMYWSHGCTTGHIGHVLVVLVIHWPHWLYRLYIGCTEDIGPLMVHYLIHYWSYGSTTCLLLVHYIWLH